MAAIPRSRSRRVAIVSLLCASVFSLLLTGPTAPRAHARQDDGKSAALAQSLFDAGRELMDQQQYIEACKKFEESQRLDPSAGTLLNIGRCLELQGKTASAWAKYRQTVVLGNATNKPRQVAAAEQYIEQIEPRLARLTVIVASEIPGLRVSVGDVEFAEASRGVPVALDPSTYAVVAEAPGHERWTGKVTLSDGAQKKIEIPALARSEDDPPPPPPPHVEPAGMSPFLIAGIAAGGAGVVGLTIGAVFGGLTLRDAAAAEDDPALCPNHACSTAGLEMIERARTEATVSTAALVVGGLAAAAGGALIGVGIWKAGSAPRATVAPLVGDTMGIIVAGGW